MEVKIPNDKHLTSKEVAVFEKITELTEKKKADSVSFFFFESRRSERVAVGVAVSRADSTDE